jgi:hypothetical protein
MQALLISADIESSALAVRLFALSHVFPLAEVLRAGWGDRSACKIQQGYCLEIPIGFQCCLTADQNPDPLGIVLHLSVRLRGGGPQKMPSPDSLNALMYLFGMRPPFSRASVDVESGEPGSIHVYQALNLCPHGDEFGLCKQEFPG